MAGIPLSWNDPMFAGVTSSSPVTIQNGGTLSNSSITETGSLASVLGVGSFTLDGTRINSQEGVRIGGGGNVNINNSYIETTGLAGDHADGIQAYVGGGGTGNVNITNTTIVSHNQNATAGFWASGGYYGTFTFNNVVFEGGPYSLRIAADAGPGHDDYVSLNNVYFVGPFEYGALLFQQVNGSNIHITEWNNVRYATIVNGQLVPGALIPPPLPVEGGTSTAPTTLTAPAAPTIASFSPDTGVVGDGITDANTIELKGTAAAGSTVKIYDGSAQIGSTTATSTGSWDYITKVLTDAVHTLTATATNSSGQTSAASSALAVTVDTKAPAAPAIAGDTVNSANQVVVIGTAEAGSNIKLYDGTTEVGTATTNANGSWTVTTSALSVGSHALSATATDAAGNVSAHSAPLDPVIQAPTTGVGQAPSGGQNLVTNGSFETGDFTGWTLGGNYKPLWGLPQTYINTGAENGTFAAALGSVGSDGTLSQNVQTTAGQHYAVSFWLANHGSGPNDFAVTWNGQTELALANKSAQGYTQYSFTATGTAGTSHLEFDARQDPSHWSLDNVSVVAVGSQSSQPLPPAPTTSTKPLELTNLQTHSNDTATIMGTADANSQIKLYDGTSLLGSAKAGADGTWSFTTAQLSNAVHTFKAQEVDSTGHVVATSSGNAVLGSSCHSTLTSSTGNDILVGQGHSDTFVFAPNFGNDVIQNFIASGRGHDTIQFSKTEFNSFASVLSHASQVGNDVVIATGSDSVTLKNVKIGALNSHDFHFA
jgi:hypothetical protein